MEALESGDGLRERAILLQDNLVERVDALSVLGKDDRELVVRLDERVECVILGFLSLLARLSEAHELGGLHLERAREGLHGVDGGVAELVPPHELTPHVVVLSGLVKALLGVLDGLGHVELHGVHERVGGVSVLVGRNLAVEGALVGAHALEVVRGGDHRGVVRLEEREVVHVQRVADGAHLGCVVQRVRPLGVGVFVLHLRERCLCEGCIRLGAAGKRAHVDGVVAVHRGQHLVLHGVAHLAGGDDVVADAQHGGLA